MKILVVDDEKFIRQGIKYMLEEDIKDIQVIVANNGTEALDRLSSQRVDIMITDITMPMMDGITLIAEVRKLYEDMPIFVLSGFNDFEYARKCIDYKIEKYILKPVEKDEMITLVNQTINKLKLEKKEEKKEIINEIKYEMSKTLKNNEEILLRLNKLGINSKMCKLFYFKTNDNVTDEHLIEYEEGYLLITESNYQFNKQNCEFVLETNVSSDISLLLEQLSILKKYQNIIDKTHITYKMVENNNLKFYHDEKIMRILELMKNREKYLAINMFNEIFLDNHVNKYDWTFYYDMYNTMKRLIFDEYLVSNEKYEDLIFKNIKEYKNLLLKKMMESYDNMSKDNNIEIIYIEKAKKYIAKNYNKHINMAMVSNYVSINYSYFSILFKKYMKMSFSDYLNKIRIEKAKELLKRVDYKIYDIAEEVGYTNSKYFTRAFKKYEKMSPNEYKIKNIERK